MKRLIALSLTVLLLTAILAGCSFLPSFTETPGASANPQPTEGTQGTQPTEGDQPTAGTQPTAPAEPTDPTDPTDPTEPVDPNFVEDNTVYYLVGFGLGTMAQNNWNINDDSLTMQRQDVSGRNLYVIEISLYAGDQFQICHDYDWAGQQGIGLIVGAQQVSNDLVEVKDANGTLIFYEYMEHNNPISMWNVTLAEGQDGVYRFTLETFPGDPSKNVITYELIERLEPQQQTPSTDAKMHVLGSFNNWNTADTTEEYYMTLSADGTCYQVYLTATAGTTFKAHNQTTNTWHPDGMGNDLYIPEDGTYLITYTIATGALTFEKVS